MVTLTQAAIITRKMVRYSILFLLFLILAKAIFDISARQLAKVFPKATPAPDVAFGKLPALPIEKKENSNFSFRLETAEISLPKLATQAKVFLIPKVSSNLLGLEFATQKASLLGFSNKGERLTETLYRFPHKTVHSALEMNIVTGAFSISYDLASDVSPLSFRPQAPPISEAYVRSFLSAANILPKDLSDAASYEFLKRKENEFVGAVSLSEADVVKVDLFRKGYEDMPSVTEKGKEGNIWFIVSGSQEREKQILFGEYHYFLVDESQSSTYPLRTSEEAWDELKSGGGFVASPGDNLQASEVVIRKVYLGYFDPASFMGYFQPVFVFEGDGGFVAYVPAISKEYYGK